MNDLTIPPNTPLPPKRLAFSKYARDHRWLPLSVMFGLAILITVFILVQFSYPELKTCVTPWWFLLAFAIGWIGVKIQPMTNWVYPATKQRNQVLGYMALTVLAAAAEASSREWLATSAALVVFILTIFWYRQKMSERKRR